VEQGAVSEGRYERVCAEELADRSPRKRLLPDRHIALFLVVISALSLVAAMTLAPVPLSLDGPSHIYFAVVMRHLWAGDPFYREHFYLSSPLIPNWLASVIAAAAVLPEKSQAGIVLMNALVLLLTAAALYFVAARSAGSRFSPERRLYSFAILLPLAANGFLISGFWGFLISVDLCLFAVGVLQADANIRRRITVAILVLLAYWAHPVPVLLTACIPAAGYIRALYHARPPGRERFRKLTVSFAADILPWAVAGLLIAGFTWVLARQPVEPEQAGFRSQLVNRFLALISLRLPLDKTRVEVSTIWPTATAGGLFYGYTFLLGAGALAPLGRKVALRGQLAAFAAVVAVLYFLVPSQVGTGSFIPERLLWLAIAVCGVLAVSGALAANMLYLRSCAICAAAMVLVLSGEFFGVSRRLAPAVVDLRQALAAVPPRSQLLMLGYRATPDCFRWPILEDTVPERHLAMIEAIPRQLIVLNDYEPATAYFPVQYRDPRFSSEESPLDTKNEFDFSPTKQAAWSRALQSLPAGSFVVSWGVASGGRACEAFIQPPLEGNLQQHYELRYEKANASRVQVWQRRAD
jgi:hypothetical protein